MDHVEGTPKKDFLAAMDELRRMLGPTLAKRHRDFEEMLARLRADSYHISYSTDAVPVQIQGRLPTGEGFYFRSRWDTARPDVWDDWTPTPNNVGEERFRHPDWSGSYRDASWEMFEAGWLEAEDAEAIVRSLSAICLRGSWRPLSPSGSDPEHLA
jgi:hypothetical protein